MNDDYVSDLRAFCTEWLKQNRGCDLINHGFGAEHGGELTTVKLIAALDELEKLRDAVRLEREAFDMRGARVAQQRAELSAAWKERDDAKRELVKVCQQIGEHRPGPHCPWCGTPVRLDLDGLVPSHEHPTYFDECPGTRRRPSPEAAEDPSWTDHGDGWKSRRPTLSDFQGPFTGLLGPFGTDDAGEPS